MSNPWDGEPDEREWQDAATGLTCFARRNKHLGAWAGYVVVPEGHPWHGVDHWNAPAVDADVHGGLTCSGRLRARPADWLVGFDCWHDCDACPGLDVHAWARPDAVYRTLAFVEGECAKLAAAVAAAGKPSA